MKKTITLFIITILFFSSILIPITIANKPTTSSHLIEGVPYVGQETDFFCTYACPTMAIQYYGINTTLNEVLFNSGLGYSLVYSIPKLNRFIISTTGSSNWYADRIFLADLYGLTFQEQRLFDPDIPENDNWDIYWSKLKENISENAPVITLVDPIFLSSIRKCASSDLGISEEFLNKFPDILWDFVPCLINHMIIIVGYNEDNDSICYNDPVAEVLGHKEFGYYEWMSLSDYKNAMIRFSKKTNMAYSLIVFKNSTNLPYNKTTIFKKAYERNIGRMEGNLSMYDSLITHYWGSTQLGINSLKQLKNDLGKGLENRIKTIILYKFQTAKYLYSAAYKIYNFFDKLSISLLNISDFNSQMNFYYQMAIEKQYISEYLWETQFEINDSYYSDICKNDSILLSYEAENCSKLADEFLIFLKRGLFLTLPRAIKATENMSDILSKMIFIEEKIIEKNQS